MAEYGRDGIEFHAKPSEGGGGGGGGIKQAVVTYLPSSGVDDGNYLTGDGVWAEISTASRITLDDVAVGDLIQVSLSLVLNNNGAIEDEVYFDVSIGDAAGAPARHVGIGETGGPGETVFDDEVFSTYGVAAWYRRVGDSGENENVHGSIFYTISATDYAVNVDHSLVFNIISYFSDGGADNSPMKIQAADPRTSPQITIINHGQPAA